MAADLEAPSIAVIIPAYQAARTIRAALESLRAQSYAGACDIYVIDGGSTDGTREIAASVGAHLIENPERRQEPACGIGIDSTTSDLVLLFDADDELPHSGWLERMVRAIGLADDVAAADPLFHTWRPRDPAINRLCALIGGTDPIAIDLGWSDRWGYHRDRWTGMPAEEEEVGGELIVRIDPRRAPPMGSNGFLVRRDALQDVSHNPFWHPDVVAELAQRGWRFARVRDSVIHHFAEDNRDALRKIQRRARRALDHGSSLSVRPPLGWRRLGPVVLSSLTLVVPVRDALRGFRRRRDSAWALYPLLHLAWTLAYGEALVRRAFGGGRRR